MDVVQGGVQRESTLGMKYGPVTPPQAAAPVENNDWLDKFEVLALQHTEALAEIDRLDTVARILWGLLDEILPHTCMLHEEPEKGCENCYAIEVHQSLAEFAPGSQMALDPCPECVQGKHPNCAHQTLAPDGETLVPCPCEVAGHEA